MRVLVVTWQMAPDSGWGRYSLGLVRGLRERGIQIRILTERRSPAGPEYRDIDVIPCLSTPLAPLDRLDALAWNLGQVVRHSGGSDLVHFFVEPYALAASLLFPRPYLLTVHGTYGVVPLRGNPMVRILFARALRRAEAVICVSRFTRSRVDAALRLDNLAVVNNGLELPMRSKNPAAPSESVPGDPVLLGVGALKPRKGYHVAVEALSTVRQRYPNVHYYLVGDDRDHRYVDQLRESIRSLDLERYVTITGRVDDNRLDALYRHARVFVLSPVNSGLAFEGFGLTYLEANAYGTPVVGSFDCGAEDAIQDGVNGLLAPQGDAAALARQILRVLDDPAGAARMGERGRELARARDWTHVANEYCRLYERALGR